MTEQETKQAIREWIIQKNGKINAADLTDETSLIENRIISSVQIMGLILFLEQLRNRPLNIQDLKPGVFKNINSIYQNFMGASHD